MDTDVRNFVQTCPECQMAKRDYHPQKVPLQPLPVEDIFHTWHVDCIGKLPTTPQGYNYVLLCVESFSRHPEAFPLYTLKATEIATVIFKQIICRYGAMKTLITDMAQDLRSEVMNILCKLCSVHRTYTGAYRPQTNSKCERFKFKPS